MSTIPISVKNFHVSDKEENFSSCEKHQLFFVLNDIVYVDVAFENRAVSNGRCFYLSPGLIHKLSGADSRILKILIPQEMWKKFTSKNFLFMRFTPSLLLKELTLSLQHSWENSLRQSLEQSFVQLLILELSEQCHPVEKSFRPLEHRLHQGLDPRVEEALRLILENSRLMTVSKLAQETHLSERQLHRLFEKHLSISPIQALRQAKVERAMDLLQSTPQSVTRIAENAGFSSLAQFNETFLEFSGQSPSQYRKAQRLRCTRTEMPTSG